jgi:hypothetical protein
VANALNRAIFGEKTVDEDREKEKGEKESE